MKKAALGICILLLSACVSPEEQAAQERAQQQAILAGYQAQCSAFGFTPGTNEFANCMLEMNNQRNARVAAVLSGGPPAWQNTAPVFTPMQ